MHSIVIADTSCFILLTKINEVELLRQLYEGVYTTPEIAAEFGNDLPEWVIVQSVINKDKVALLEKELDAGEASAIALTYELPDSIIILDDMGARKVARRLHITFTGTFGIIAKAKNEGIISSVIPLLNKIRTTNFRFSDDVFNETLKQAGE